MNTLPYCAVLCLVMISHVWQGARAQSGADAKALTEKIFVTDSYNKKIRPTLVHNDTTEVWVSFYLLSIAGLDEVTQTLKTTGYLFVEWYDNYLTWNASDYGGIDYYLWPQNDVWKPDITLKNSYLDYKELGAPSLNVEVYNDGYVLWFPFQLFQSTCSVDITNFPFDTQTCKLKFVAWSYTSYEITMKGGSNGINVDEFEPNSEWDVLSSTQQVEVDGYEASIVYTLTMKRKPRYHLLNVVLPIIMLAVLNLFVFVLPCDSGEKASFAVTVFLAFAVFLTIISSTMPENSESTATFSVFVIIQTLQSVFISVTALVLIRLHSFGDETPVPEILITVIQFAKCKPCRNRNKAVVQVAPKSENAENGTRDMLKFACVRDEAPFTWRDAANGLDYLCFILFSLTVFLSTLICLTVAATAE